MKRFGLLLAIGLAAPVCVLAEGTAVQAKIGSLGLGIEISHEFSEQIGARAGVNTFQYDFDARRADIDYDFRLKLKSISALLDYRPAAGAFRLTGGALINGNKIDGVARSDNSYAIGGQVYALGDVGTLTGNIDFDGFAPYLGLGWSTPSGAGGNFGVSVDLGVVVQGSPQVRLESTGALADDAAFQADLAAEEKDLQAALDGFEYYPVLSVGVLYRF